MTDAGSESPFDLISSPWGIVERWRATALQTGELGALSALSKQVANDSAAALDALETREQAVLAREDACTARERKLADAAAKVSALADRAADEWDRVQQARADQEREPLPAPPGAVTEAALPGDPSAPGSGDDTPAPSGELHSVAAKQEPDVQPDAGGEFLRLHNDETEFPAGELPPPPQQQPIAAGLDGED